MAEAASVKVCFLCKQDCSSRPRVKDQHGRYVCKVCADEREKARGRGTVAAVIEGSRPSGPPAVASESAAEDVFELMPEGLLADGPSPCPSCNAPIPSGGVLCLGCGYDVRKGSRLSTGIGVDDPSQHAPPLKGKPAAAKCPGCGYDLKGLKTPRCPECGKLVLKKSRAEVMEEESRRTARDAWFKPLVMIVAGVAGTCIWELIADPSGGEAVRSVVGLAFQVPIGLAVYFLCCLIWIGFDMPWRLITLRLTAVYAMTSLIGLPVSLIPVGIAQFGIMVIVYVGLLMDMLDLELQDAAIVAVGTVIANAFIAVTLVAMAMG